MNKKHRLKVAGLSPHHNVNVTPEFTEADKEIIYDLVLNAWEVRPAALVPTFRVALGGRRSERWTDAQLKDRIGNTKHKNIRKEMATLAIEMVGKQALLAKLRDIHAEKRKRIT